jgi:hypothetical protein
MAVSVSIDFRFFVGFRLLARAVSRLRYRYLGMANAESGMKKMPLLDYRQILLRQANKEIFTSRVFF